MPGDVPGGAGGLGPVGPPEVDHLSGFTPPVVDAGGPYVGKIAVATQLAATITPGSDPSPTITWSIQAGGTGTFSDPNIEDPTFTPDGAGPYTLLLTVDPSDGAAETDTATFRIGGFMHDLSRECMDELIEDVMSRHEEYF